MNAGIVEIFEATEYPTAMDRAYSHLPRRGGALRLERRGLAKAAWRAAASAYRRCFRSIDIVVGDLRRDAVAFASISSHHVAPHDGHQIGKHSLPGLLRPGSRSY